MAVVVVSVVIWGVVWCALGWLIGDRKGEASYGLLLGLFLGPIGVVIALLTKRQKAIGSPYCVQCNAKLVIADGMYGPECSRGHVQPWASLTV